MSLLAYDEAVPLMQYLSVEILDIPKTYYCVLVSLLCATSHFHFYILIHWCSYTVQLCHTAVDS